MESKLNVVNLKPNDKLVLMLDEYLPDKIMESSIANLKRWAGPDLHVLILPKGMRLTVISPEEDSSTYLGGRGDQIPTVLGR